VPRVIVIVPLFNGVEFLPARWRYGGSIAGSRAERQRLLRRTRPLYAQLVCDSGLANSSTQNYGSK
jgi:hypothetical protein